MISRLTLGVTNILQATWPHCTWYVIPRGRSREHACTKKRRRRTEPCISATSHVSNRHSVTLASRRPYGIPAPTQHWSVHYVRRRRLHCILNGNGNNHKRLAQMTGCGGVLLEGNAGDGTGQVMGGRVRLLAELVVDETGWACRRYAHSGRRLRAGVFGLEVCTGLDYPRPHHPSRS